MPNRFRIKAKPTKQTPDNKAQEKSVVQNPSLGNSKGNARNIGNVGTTYQNVYQAWLATFSSGWFSICNQIRARIVTSGKAASRPPSRSLRLAASDTSTTTADVIRYFVIIQSI